MNLKHNLIGVLSGIFIGISVVIASHATKTVNPLVFSTISPILAFPILLILMNSFSGKGFNSILKDNRKDFLMIYLERGIIAGLLFIFGLNFTIAIRSVFLVQLEVAFVFLWSILLMNEKARKKKVFFIATLLLGAFLLTTNGSIEVFKSFLLGDALIIIALALFSHSYIVAARLMKSANPLKLSLLLIVLGLPVYAILALVLLPLSAFYIGYEFLFLILISSISFNIIGFPLWLISLKRIKPWMVAAVLVVQPIAGALLSFFWLGQILSVVQMAGGALILISVYFISLMGKE